MSDLFERNFRIDPRIQDLLPRQTTLEFQGLAKQIEDSEYVDPGVVLVIAGDRVLGDGHHRLEICDQVGLFFPTRDKIVGAWEEAIQWVIDNQLGRRNLSDERKSYYRGKEYLLKKQPVGGQTPSPIKGVGHNVPPPQRVSEQLAEKHGVNEKTIRRDADFAEAVDRVGEEDGPEAREEILSGESGRTREEIIAPTKPPPTHEPRKRTATNGQEVFEIKKVHEYLGWTGNQIARWCHEVGSVDERGIPCGHEFNGISRKLKELCDDIDAWHKKGKPKGR